jgi:hypothetical protein
MQSLEIKWGNLLSDYPTYFQVIVENILIENKYLLRNMFRIFD